MVRQHHFNFLPIRILCATFLIWLVQPSSVQLFGAVRFRLSKILLVVLTTFWINARLSIASSAFKHYSYVMCWWSTLQYHRSQTIYASTAWHSSMSINLHGTWEENSSTFFPRLKTWLLFACCWISLLERCLTVFETINITMTQNIN